MPDKPSSSVRQFIQGVPIVQVGEPEQIAAYFRDVLGFNCDYGDVQYAVVWRENAVLHFVRSWSSGSRTYRRCTQEYSRSGARITQEPHVQPYGIRDFHVRDPNGLVLIFGQDVD